MFRSNSEIDWDEIFTNIQRWIADVKAMTPCERTKEILCKLCMCTTFMICACGFAIIMTGLVILYAIGCAYQWCPNIGIGM